MCPVSRMPPYSPSAQTPCRKPEVKGPWIRQGAAAQQIEMRHLQKETLNHLLPKQNPKVLYLYYFLLFSSPNLSPAAAWLQWDCELWAGFVPATEMPTSSVLRGGWRFLWKAWGVTGDAFDKRADVNSTVLGAAFPRAQSLSCSVHLLPHRWIQHCVQLWLEQSSGIG